MDLKTRKKRLDDLAAEIARGNTQINADAQRAGGFGDELSKAVAQRDDTYKTLDNSVNKSRQSFYNTTEDALPQVLAESPDDPMMAFQNLGRERMRRGTQYQNDEDIRSRKKGSVADFINSFVRSAGLVVDRKRADADNIRQQFGMEESQYNRDFQEQQAAEQRRIAQAQLALQQQAAAEARAARSSAASSQKSGMTSAYIQNLKARAEQFASQNGKYVDYNGEKVFQSFDPGTPEWQGAYDNYIKKNLQADKATFSDSGYDANVINNFASQYNQPQRNPIGDLFTSAINRLMKK